MRCGSFTIISPTKLQVLELRQQISEQAQTEMSKEQRQYILRQQMRAIQDELGEKNPEKGRRRSLARNASPKPICPTRCARKPSANSTGSNGCRRKSPDHQVTRTYLELIAELPWKKSTAMSSISTTPAQCSTKIITA